MSGPGETKEGFLEVRCQCHTEARQPGAAGAPQGKSGHGRLEGDCFSAACVVAVGPPQAEEPYCSVGNRVGEVSGRKTR